jgi:DNA-nicking Smr family endonuclease
MGEAIQDQVQAKSATYGNGKRHEKECMTKLRQSAMKDTKRLKRQPQQRESENTDRTYPLAQPDTAQSRNEASSNVVGSHNEIVIRRKRDLLSTKPHP